MNMADDQDEHCRQRYLIWMEAISFPRYSTKIPNNNFHVFDIGPILFIPIN